jgi:hypothetical protein
VIGATHALNASDGAVSTGMRMTLTTIPTVRVKLAPFRLNYNHLHIPAMGSAEFSASCDVKTTHEKVMGTPFDLKLYYVLPHYHTLGNRFELRLHGGARDGELVYDRRSRHFFSSWRRRSQSPSAWEKTSQTAPRAN